MFGAPAMNPDVRSRTSNVWVTSVIVPDRKDRSALADARSAALTPPGNWDADSCTDAGAPGLKPKSTVGNRAPYPYVFTRTCCRPPPNCSSWRPRCHDPLSLYWNVRVVRPCGWNDSTGLVTKGTLNSAVPNVSFVSNRNGARLPPPRTSLVTVPVAHRHAPTKRCTLASVKTTGRSCTTSSSLLSSISWNQ